MILDAHVHLPCREGLDTLEDKKKRLLRDIANAGVDAAIVIADSETASAIGTPSECAELFADQPHIFIIGGLSPLIKYEAHLRQLKSLLKSGAIVAVKLYPGHEAYSMDDPRLFNAFALCKEHSVPLAVHTGWSNPQYTQPRFFANIAQNHPTLRIALCHMCWPSIDACFDATKDYPNLYYDISSLAHNSARLKSTKATLARVAQSHAHRLLFGSDYGACDIAGHIDLVQSLEIEQEKKRAILYDNAARLYGIGRPGSHG